MMSQSNFVNGVKFQKRMYVINILLILEKPEIYFPLDDVRPVYICM